jgi:predicted phage tail protein
MPARNAPGSSVQNIDRADIYRLAETAGSPAALSEEEFASRATLISTVALSDADFGLKTLTFTDPISLTATAPRLRYAVRLANRNGQKAAFSNFLLITPTTSVALAPTGPAAEARQEAVRLTWKRPAGNIDRSTPPNLLGYNVYRTAEGSPDPRKLNQTPVGGESFDDRAFEFGKKYSYVVRAVSLGGDAEPVESSDSEAVEIEPRDVFAPAPPASITIAAAPGVISIFFPANAEPDVAGYLVFRSEDGSADPALWTKVTAEPLKTTTFQDSGVVSGKRYYYYLKAVDRYGNVSAASEIVSETAP